MLIGSGFLLLHRIHFIYRAKTVIAVVVEKVFRNRSTETRSSRAKVLKLSFEHPAFGQTDYFCDTSIITPLFKINDLVKLSVLGNKVIVKHWLYLILAPLALITLGIICIGVFYQL